MSEADIALGRMKQSIDQLGHEISNGKYPADLLADMKTSVDQLRLNMWAAIESEDQRKQEIRGGPTNFRKKLVEFRIKRLVEMLNNLRIGVAEGDDFPETSVLQTLRAALWTTLKNLESLAARNI